jgi:hypothetical protein
VCNIEEKDLLTGNGISRQTMNHNLQKFEGVSQEFGTVYYFDHVRRYPRSIIPLYGVTSVIFNTDTLH